MKEEIQSLKPREDILKPKIKIKNIFREYVHENGTNQRLSFLLRRVSLKRFESAIQLSFFCSGL